LKPVAAIDIGSNTVHLLVGATHRRGSVEHLESQSELLQLGREVRKHGRIRPKKLKAVKRVLKEYLKVARNHGVREVLIGATGAVRAAENGAAAMKKLERALGVPIQILSGESEGRLAFLGATLTLKKNEPQLLIDSGGSSTEVTLTTGRRRRASESMPIGASLLCAELKNDPPGPLEWARLSLQLGDALRRLPTAPRPRRAVAVGGAAHRIEELHGAGRGAPVGLPDLEEIAKRLLRRSSKQIERATGVPRKKVALLAAGALILHAVLSHYGLESVDIGHSGLRDGMILAHRSVSGNWWRYRR
jgi:exopolyphosphatase / guanosine-5'-triphosphate,3'-diphosphate pyrophosphatase